MQVSLQLCDGSGLWGLGGIVGYGGYVTMGSETKEKPTLAPISFFVLKYNCLRFYISSYVGILQWRGLVTCKYYIYTQCLNFDQKKILVCLTLKGLACMTGLELVLWLKWMCKAYERYPCIQCMQCRVKKKLHIFQHGKYVWLKYRIQLADDKSTIMLFFLKIPQPQH